MLLTEEKIRKRIEELVQYRYRDVRMFHAFLISEDVSGIPNPPVPVFDQMEEKIYLKDRWKGRDKYLWLERKTELPKEWEALSAYQEAVGVFDFGRSGGGNNSGFEAMLYIDGVPFQAADSNHKEVFFKPEHFGREITLTFRLWSGLEGGGIPREVEHEIQTAFIGLLDKKTEDLYYLADTILRTVSILPESRIERHDLLIALDWAFKLLDWSEPGSTEFYASVSVADQYLNDRLAGMEKDKSVTVSCVGHTHIDTAWLWRLKHTREKASRSFASVLRLMELYPEYYFLQTQPQLYKYMKEDFPQIYEGIQKRVAEGRWEIDGAMWVEADCNLTSGESLTRQILLGRKFMKEEFGKEPEFLWLPDVFGYSWALPQILKKSGIEMFMTTKISWNQYNRMPHDTFWWRGIDGSEVLAHFLTTPALGQREENWRTTYTGELYPETVQGSWDRYREKDVNREILFAYGYGDGGGGVNRDLLERGRRLARIPGIPNVRTTTAGAYFNRLKERAKNTDEYVHTWDGELYLEYHRGTYTSQAYNKKANRKMEILYRKAEWMTAMEGLAEENLEYAHQEALTEGWHIILTHQFHDIIPGSSIHEVYEDSRENYRIAEEIAQKQIESFLSRALCEDQNCISILNQLGEDANGLVWIEGLKEGVLHNTDGTTVLVQREKNGAWVYVEKVPSMGVKYLYLTETEREEADEIFFREEYKGNILKITSPFYRMELNEEGQIISLYDKEYGRQILEEGQKGNEFQLFEDKPLGNDAWDIDIFYSEKREVVGNKTERTIAEKGPLRMVIRQKWEFGHSVIEQDMILYTHDRRIDFKTKVDWQERHKLLKTAFPLDIRATEAVYDIQYGNVKRPTHRNTSWDMARFESVAHRWVDLSEYGYGVSLLNDCKYGHDIHDNVIRLTLLKGAVYPDYAADMGKHSFTYSLYPHKGDFVDGRTVNAAALLNQPLEVVNGMVNLPTNEKGYLIRLEGAYVELDAFKKSEDGQYLVLRFHEYAGARGKVSVTTGFAVKEFAESDLMERPIEEFRNGDVITTYIRPYEIKTLLLRVYEAELKGRQDILAMDKSRYVTEGLAAEPR